jgi:hypothetical protein
VTDQTDEATPRTTWTAMVYGITPTPGKWTGHTWNASFWNIGRGTPCPPCPDCPPPFIPHTGTAGQPP